MAALPKGFINPLNLAPFQENKTLNHSAHINFKHMNINKLISCCLNPKPHKFLSPLVKPASILPPIHPKALLLKACPKPRTKESPLLPDDTDALCMELRLSTFWKFPELKHTGKGNVFPRRGILKIHGLWSGYISSGLAVVHYYNVKNSLVFPTNAALTAAKKRSSKDLHNQLDAKQIEDLKAIWFNGDEKFERFWANECVKHNQYFVGEFIPKYYATVGKLALPLFDGSKKDLRTILLEEGFEVGKYHSVQRLLQVLEKRLGVKCSLTFYDHFGHPCLSDICILYSRDGQMMDHPCASQVPDGFFLFRSIDMI